MRLELTALQSANISETNIEMFSIAQMLELRQEAEGGGERANQLAIVNITKTATCHKRTNVHSRSQRRQCRQLARGGRQRAAQLFVVDPTARHTNDRVSTQPRPGMDAVIADHRTVESRGHSDTPPTRRRTVRRW